MKNRIFLFLSLIFITVTVLLESALELLELDTEDSQARLDAPIRLYKTSIKYLCRGECPPWGTKVIPVQSGSAEDQRFSLDDDTAARVFTITITDLRAEDGGRYWCGVKRPQPLPDLFTEILLLVEQGE
ncbi:hypothetical protein SRHO_G00179110 [Serrasalmus rhombeus]